MNYEKMGICVTIVIVAVLASLAVIATGDIVDLGIVEQQITQQYNSSTDTSSNSAYFEWCYKMNIPCNKP